MGWQAARLYLDDSGHEIQFDKVSESWLLQFQRAHLEVEVTSGSRLKGPSYPSVFAERLTQYGVKE